MPAARTVRRSKAKIPDNLSEVVREYCLNRGMRERSDYFEKSIKAGLMELLAQVGAPDGENGEHRRIDLPEPVEFTTYKGGKGTKKTVIAIQRQERKGSMTLNEERTLAFLAKNKKLLASCTTTVTVINEDALLAANFEGAISDAVLATLYDEADPTYAFYPVMED